MLHNSTRGSIYIVSFDSGVVKVGRSANAFSRLKSHISSASAIGVSANAFYISKELADQREGESRLIEYFESKFERSSSSRSTKEYFKGVSLKDVEEFIDGFDIPMFKFSDVFLGCKGGRNYAALHIDLGKAEPAPEGGGVDVVRLRESIIRVLSKYGELTKGVLINRVRSAPSRQVEEALYDMVYRGAVVENESKNSGCYRYSLPPRKKNAP